MRDAEIEIAFALKAAQVPGNTWTIEPGAERTIVGEGYTLDIKSRRPEDQLYEFEIEEKHEQGSKIFPLHLQLEPPADRITRTFAADSLVARHRFQYRLPPESLTLRARTSGQIRELGVAPPPLRVEVPLHRPDTGG